MWTGTDVMRKKTVLEIHWRINNFRIKMFVSSTQIVAMILGLALDISKCCVFLATATVVLCSQ